MGRFSLFFGAMLAGLSSVGCSHAPKSYIADGRSCDLNPLRLEVPLPDETPKTLTELAAIDSYAARSAYAISTQQAPMLFLSGGSQHGAFGGGYLDEWANIKGGLPDFSVVTGISVGALQSTGAFINQPDLIRGAAQIESESELLETYVEGSAVRDGLSLGAIRTLLTEGAISDLVPLRQKLRDILTEEVLISVAEGGDLGRKLFVGATDVDTGQAVAFDMTELAKRYRNRPDDQAHLKSCYIEALVASAIVPIAAKPVFIDNNMYVDGGVRFSVFAEDVEGITELVKSNGNVWPRDKDTNEPLSIHIVVNGKGTSSQRCGRVNPDDCTGPHKDWSLIGLAARSVDLLTNQVARLSIDRAANLKRDGDVRIDFTRINEAEKDQHELAKSKLPISLQHVDDPDIADCASWEEIDRQRDNPVEFHPRYMHCLISYGRSVARKKFTP